MVNMNLTTGQLPAEVERGRTKTRRASTCNKSATLKDPSIVSRLGTGLGTIVKSLRSRSRDSRDTRSQTPSVTPWSVSAGLESSRNGYRPSEDGFIDVYPKGHSQFVTASNNDQFQLPPEMFSKNVYKTFEDIPLPGVGQSYKSILLLFRCAYLLLFVKLSSSWLPKSTSQRQPSPSSSSPSTSPLFSMIVTHPTIPLSTSSTPLAPSLPLSRSPSSSSGRSSSSPSSISGNSTLASPFSSPSSSLGSLSQSTSRSSSRSRSRSRSRSLNGLTPSEKELAWIEDVEKQPMETNRICGIVNQAVHKFISLKVITSAVINEIVYLGPVLARDSCHRLISCFLVEFKNHGLLNVHLLRGLVQLVQEAQPGFLNFDDLVRILRIIRERLEETTQEEESLVHLLLALRSVLQVMHRNKFKGLSRNKDHEPLLNVLEVLRARKDFFLEYQVCLAYQALLCIPDDESCVKGFVRHGAELIGGLLKASNSVNMQFDGIPEGLPLAFKGGLGLVNDVKEVAGITSKEPWYQAICQAQELIRAGRFSDLKIFFVKTPCFEVPCFQWGFCQLLGGVALDRSWDESIRLQAIDFLGQMYRISLKLNKKVCDWSVVILNYISNLSTEDDASSATSLVRERAAELLHGLSIEEDIKVLFVGVLEHRLPLPVVSSLLGKIDNVPTIEQRIQEIASFNRKPLSDIYISLMSKIVYPDACGELIPLETRVCDFWKGVKELMLIRGDPGSGKSISLKYLHHLLWSKYQSGDPIPLYVDLKEIHDADIVDAALRSLNFSIDQIRELKDRKFILLCDGFSECGEWVDLHLTVRRTHRWAAKIVLMSRSQYLRANYLDYIGPSQDRDRLVEDVAIVPFSVEKVQEYVSIFLEDPLTQSFFGDQPVWSTMDYMQRLLPLMDLVTNPLLLKLVLETLRNCFKNGRDFFKDQLNRAELFDVFVQESLKLEMLRLIEMGRHQKLEKACKDIFDQMEDEFFCVKCTEFFKEVAYFMFRHEEVNCVTYYVSSENKPWKKVFSPEDTMSKLLLLSGLLVFQWREQESSPSSIRKSRMGVYRVYRFMDRSMFEYFFSLTLYDPEDVYTGKTRHQGDPPYLSLRLCLDSQDQPSPLGIHPLNLFSLANESSIVSFAADRVKRHDDFRDQLFAVIRLSKTDPNVGVAASNAMTILVCAQICFNGADLRRACIPGANLTGGQFDSAQLQEANVSGVTFAGTWLRQVDFSGAIMEGTLFATDTMSTITDSSSNNRHVGRVKRVEFSQDGKFVVSVSEDSVRLWTRSSGTSKILIPKFVYDFALSSDGQNLATTDNFGLLQYHPVQEGSTVPTRYSLNGSGWLVRYSSCDRWMSTGDHNGYVKLWDLQTGRLKCTLREHMEQVTNITFSHDGRWLASVSKDRTVRILDTESDIRASTKILILKHEPSAVAFSPCGTQIAVDQGKSVHIRDLHEPEQKVLALNGHRAEIHSIAWSRDGWVAAGSSDRTVHLWKVQSTGQRETNIVSTLVIKDFVGPVSSLAWVQNPDSQMELATGSDHHSVCVWRIVEENGRIAVRLIWGSFPKRLVLDGIRINGAKGLDNSQVELLRNFSALTVEEDVTEEENRDR